MMTVIVSCCFHLISYISVQVCLSSVFEWVLKICILSDKLDEIKNEKCAEENSNSTITIFLELNGKIVIQERDC